MLTLDSAFGLRSCAADILRGGDGSFYTLWVESSPSILSQSSNIKRKKVWQSAVLAAPAHKAALAPNRTTRGELRNFDSHIGALYAYASSVYLTPHPLKPLLLRCWMLEISKD